jgi:hypothetical protein
VVAGGDDVEYLRAYESGLEIQAAASMQASLLPDPDHPLVVRLTGPCPKCTHLMQQDLPFRVLPRGATPVAIPLPVTCDCGRRHEGAPEGVTGCGRYWNLEFEQ